MTLQGIGTDVGTKPLQPLSLLKLLELIIGNPFRTGDLDHSDSHKAEALRLAIKRPCFHFQ